MKFIRNILSLSVASGMALAAFSTSIPLAAGATIALPDCADSTFCLLSELTPIPAGPNTEKIIFDPATNMSEATNWSFTDNSTGGISVMTSQITVTPTYQAATGELVMVFGSNSLTPSLSDFIDFTYSYDIVGNGNNSFLRAFNGIIDLSIGLGVGAPLEFGEIEITKTIKDIGGTTLATILATESDLTPNPVEWAPPAATFLRVENRVTVNPNGNTGVELRTWKQTFVPEPSSAMLFAANFAAMSWILHGRRVRRQ